MVRCCCDAQDDDEWLAAATPPGGRAVTGGAVRPAGRKKYAKKWNWFCQSVQNTRTSDGGKLKIGLKYASKIRAKSD